jgi:hypothetical protein
VDDRILLILKNDSGATSGPTRNRVAEMSLLDPYSPGDATALAVQKLNR